MEPGDGDFPDGGASPAALQGILRKLSAGLDDLLSASGGESSTLDALGRLNVCSLHALSGHPRMKALLADLKADGDDSRQVPCAVPSAG